jgi:hypothetical protein
MNRGNMGKQISNAPKSKSKKVKKMAFGGMASMPGGMPTPMPGGGRSPIPVPPGLKRPMPMPMPGKPAPGKPGFSLTQPSKPMPPVLRGGPAPMPGPVLRGGPGGMAKGGKVRGDGCCMKGHTKGTMK